MLFIDDILKINWLVDVLKDKKSPLLTMKSDGYLVIYYNYEEYTSRINVLREEVRYVINEDIYRTLSNTQGAEFVGYFKAPFETNNYLFYSYLLFCIRSSNTIEYGVGKVKLNQLFLNFRVEDKKKAKEKSEKAIKGTFPINSALSLSSALDEIFYVNKKPLVGLNLIFDMLKTYFEKNGVNFYGDVLNSFVKLVKNPNGGIIPQMNGQVRYLIIGENVAGDDEDLKKAKEQLRQGIDYNSIFLNTGWFYNKLDSKWRKNISDGYFGFNEENVIFTSDLILSKSSTYVGTEQDLFNDLKSLNKGKISFANLVLKGYDNKLKDVFEYNAAYTKYPKLKEIYSVVVGGRNGDFQDKYYYTNKSPERIVLMRGSVDMTSLRYIVLHEVQHYIQKVEGFGNGGNLYLADIINAVGGESTRAFLNTMDAFVEEVFEKSSTIDIGRLRNYFGPVSLPKQPKEVVSLVNKLLDMCTDNTTLRENAAEFSYILLNIYTFTFQNKAVITSIVSTFFDKKYIKLFEDTLKQSQAVLLKNQGLINKGWTPRDIYMLNFQTYQSLLGEAESRFVQNTANVDEELRDYFSLYSSETLETYKITVINENNLIQNQKVIKAAIEQANGYYIIHLPSEYSNTINILHEVGHIIYDILVDEQIVNPLDPFIESQAKKDGYETSEEYICDSFVDYIQRKKFDVGLVEDMDENRKVTNYDKFDEYFDTILLYNSIPLNEVGLKKRLNFINILTKLIENGN
jgi:hypothetical protein